MDWRSEVKKQFSQLNAIYIVKDVDEILSRTAIKKYMNSESIDILNFDDPVHFRYIYERTYRFHRSNTLVININKKNFEEVPWDVYENAFCITLTFENIFPMLDRHVLRSLPDQYLDEISKHQNPYLKKLNLNQTNDRVLRIVFGEKIQTINKEKDVEKMLQEYWRRFDEPVPKLLFTPLEGFLIKRISLPKTLLEQFTSREKFISKIGIRSNIKELRSDKKFDEQGFLTIAEEIGNYRANSLSESVPIDEEKIKEINLKFQIWLKEEYGGLPTKTSTNHPSMVHKIPEVLNRNLNQRIALLVMDGMSFTQWSIIRTYLASKNIESNVDATFAWIPSMTSVSRQSIFSGKTPQQFYNNISTTNNEHKEWQSFWKKQGIFKDEVVYMRSLGLGHFDVMSSQIAYPQVKVFGGVIDIIDKFMHSAHQGLKSVHSELHMWLENEYLLRFLNGLFELNYDVYITSDHGNIEAVGVGSIKKGVLAESSGKRMGIYENEVLRKKVITGREDIAFEWDSYYLPNKYNTIIAKDKYAFDIKDKKIVTHGGTHIEEVVVPFVRVYRSEE